MQENWLPSGYTRRPGSAKVWGSNLDCATKTVRCKNLALNFGNCVSLMAWIPCKAVGPMYIGRAFPEHVTESRAPVDKGRVKPGVTGHIPQLLRLAE